MQRLRKELTTYLRANVASANRVDPGQRTFQGTKGAHISFWVVNAPRSYTHSGTAKMVQVLIQFDCKAQTLDEAATLAQELRTALEDYSGDMGTGAGAVEIAGARWDNEYDDYLDSTGLHVIPCDYTIQFYEE